MKRLIPVVLVSLLFVQLIMALPVQAQASNEQVPISYSDFVPCALGGQGEEIQLAGNLLVQTQVTANSGGGYRLAWRSVAQGISGVGLTSGLKYRATGVTQTAINVHGLPYTYTFVNSYRIIGQGAGNNFLVKETMQITVNADGDVTASVGNASVECR